MSPAGSSMFDADKMPHVFRAQEEDRCEGCSGRIKFGSAIVRELGRPYHVYCVEHLSG